MIRSIFFFLRILCAQSAIHSLVTRYDRMHNELSIFSNQNNATAANVLRVNENNEIVGIMGKHLNRLVIPNNLSLCKFYNQEKIGEKQANGSYDGAIGRLQNKITDIFFKPEPPFFDPDIIGCTPAARSENYLIGHPIEKKKRSKQVDREMVLESVDFTYMAYILIALFWFFCLSTLFFYCKLTLNSKRKSGKFCKSIELVLNFFINDFMAEISHKTLVLFFFILFISLTKQFLSINIKTTKVIVDTSQFIKDEDALFRLPKKVYWIKGTGDIYLAQKSQKGSFLHKLYSLKNFNPPLMVDSSINRKPSSNRFLFTTQLFMTVVSLFVVNIFPIDYYVNLKPFFSQYNIFLRRKEISAKTEYIDDHTVRIYEAGIMEKTIDMMKNEKIVQSNGLGKIYYDIDSYIDDNTHIESINLDNFLYILISYFIVLLIMYTCFLGIQKL